MIILRNLADLHTENINKMSTKKNWADPRDFVTKVKQINTQSDLISMSSFADPITIRSLYFQSL